MFTFDPAIDMSQTGKKQFVKSFFTSFYKLHLEGYLDHRLLKQDEFDKE
jgi:hypothetical protein